MRRVIPTIVLVSLCAGPIAALPAAADDAYQWGGVYVGAGIGAINLGGDERDTHTVPPHTDTASGDHNWSALGTISAGYDFRMNADVLIGVFAEFDFTNADFKIHTADGDVNRLELNHAFNVGGRIGYLALPSLLIFAEGGYSRGDFDFHYSNEYSNNTSFDGWFIGGGMERKITGQLSLELSYRFTRYGEELVGLDENPPPPPPPPPMADNEEHFADADQHAIRVGLNYSFGTGP